MFFGHMFTIATDAIIWTSQPLAMCFDVFVFHNFCLVFMIFQGIFMVFHGFWLVFMVFIFLEFTIVNDAMFFAKLSGSMFLH